MPNTFRPFPLYGSLMNAPSRLAPVRVETHFGRPVYREDGALESIVWSTEEDGRHVDAAIEVFPLGNRDNLVAVFRYKELRGLDRAAFLFVPDADPAEASTLPNHEFVIARFSSRPLP